MELNGPPMSNVVTELLDLFPDVSAEGVSWPSANHHDCVDWALAQVHHHGCTQSNQVSTNVFFLESQDFFSNSCDGKLEDYCDVC